MGYIMELRRKIGREPLFMPGGGVFFVDGDGRVLLQRRRDNGLWAGTGGALEPGETFEDAARREAYEELGLVPGRLELLNIYSGESQHYIYPNGDEVYVVAAVHLCRDWTGTLRVDEAECLDARFFTVEELPDVDEIHPPDIPMVADLRQWMLGREKTWGTGGNP